MVKLTERDTEAEVMRVGDAITTMSEECFAEGLDGLAPVAGRVMLNGFGSVLAGYRSSVDAVEAAGGRANDVDYFAMGVMVGVQALLAQCPYSVVGIVDKVAQNGCKQTLEDIEVALPAEVKSVFEKAVK